MSPLQHRFVAEYVKDLNATAAIERAGSGSGRPQQAASELLRNPEVLAAINSEMQRANRNIGIDAAWWARRVPLIFDADLRDVYDSSNRLRPPGDWPLVWRRGTLTGLRRHSDSNGNVRSFGIRQVNGLRLLVLLGDYVGCWTKPKRRAGSLRRTLEVGPQPTPPYPIPAAVFEAAGLTDRQRIFVKEYLSGCSAAEAAGRSGSRANNLRQAGHEMLKARPIRTVIDAVEVAAQNQNRLWRTTRIRSLVEILDADLADIFDGHCLRPFSEWPAVWRSGALVKLPVSKQVMKGGHSFNLRLIDRTPLLEMLGMLVGAVDASHHSRELIAQTDGLSRRLDRVSKALSGSSGSSPNHP